MAKSGTMVKNAKGQFVGAPGPGRPKGSKNKVTLMKIMAEEAARERNADRIQAVIDLIIDDALDGQQYARKLIWDGTMSKPNVGEDKNAGNNQKITVHRMSVVKSDVDNTQEED